LITTTLRFNFALPGQDPAENARRHRSSVVMAEEADRAGLSAISLEEHHGVMDENGPMGWCASPIAVAAALLARTERVTVALWGIALPLHDPVRIAEDVATLDLLAPGRVVLIVNVGDRAEEFAAHGQDYAAREQLFDDKLTVLRAAWTDGGIAVDGTTHAVTPRPVTRPHPMLMIGGATVEDARRAARHALPFRPSAHHTQLRDAYLHTWSTDDHEPLYLAPPARTSIVQVAEDPDEWWSTVGHHLLAEARTYAGWMTPGEHSAVHSRAATVSELRREGIYRVLTPTQCVEQARRDHGLLVHPLCGGTPLDRAETSVGLFIDQVLPALQA